MADVVAVPYVREVYASRGAEFFLVRKEITEGLARMINIRERVDHRNCRMRREDVERVLRKHARHDSMHPARKASPNIGNGFAVAQMRIRMIEINRRAAQTGDANFKGHACAER